MSDSEKITEKAVCGACLFLSPRTPQYIRSCGVFEVFPIILSVRDLRNCCADINRGYKTEFV